MRRILIAEDNPADVYLLREALGQEDIPVDLVVVSDGEEAINYIEGRGRFEGLAKPDLIILDLNLPKTDGGDVLRCIRGNPHYADVPVVVFTSSDSPRDRGLAAELGAESFLTKPSDLDQFLRLGRVLLSHLRPPEHSTAAG